MPISADCPQCGKTYNVKDDLAGKKFRCKECEGVVTVPAAGGGGGGKKDPWDDLDLGSFQDQAPAEDDEFEAPLPRRRAAGKKKSKSRSGGADSGGKDAVAIIALVAGCINLLAWCLPICGLPLSIGGIVCGILGMGSPTKRGLAIAGLILSVLGLIGSIVNAALGAMMMMQGNHPMFQ